MTTQSQPPAVPGGFKYDGSIADTQSDRVVDRYALSLNQREQIERAILHQEIYVTKTESFSATFLNIFDRYILPPVTTDATVQEWKAHPMKFWQNQLNFAVWCASAGCGVAVNTHILGNYDFALEAKFLCRAIYRFHIYFTVRRILKEMDCPLPADSGWNPFNNTINMHQYELICNEFFINPKKSWVISGLSNWGLGQMRQRSSGTARGDDHLAGETYSPAFHFFGSVPRTGGVHIDHIAQEGDDPKIGWAEFIPGLSRTLTQPGRVRINQSIRSYCWAILIAQEEAREPIVGTGSTGAAQRKFTELIEQACVQRGGVEYAGTTGSGTTQIDYERVLQKARSKLDFSVGEGLYLIPSDMTLHDLSGSYNGYNNQLKVATSGLGLGENTNINLERAQRAEKNTPAQVPAKAPAQDPAQEPTKAPTQAPTQAPAPKPAPTPKNNTVWDDHNELLSAIKVTTIGALVYMLYVHYTHG
jgi:hypothetical protein